MADDRQPATYPPLLSLWQENLNDLRCYNCNKSFTADLALIRTFKVLPASCNRNGQAHSKAIDVRDEVIVIYDRCFPCLTSNVEYITVSHVWDPNVAAAQNAGPSSAVSAAVQALVYQYPIDIYHGIVEAVEEAPEVWHDYISVPQWTEGLKEPILRAIPKLFSNSQFTLIHLHDVSPRSVQLLRQTSSIERIQGLTSTCNSIWFRRIWTAMEYVRSGCVKIMLDDHRVLGGVKDLFMDMDEIWSDEIRRHGSVHTLTKKMGDLIGSGNLVPWRLGLGPLRDVAILRQTCFAHAFTLLSQRLCSNTHDFFYALLGIVRADLKAIDVDDRKACRQIATSCMESGDYSPILMIPRKGNHRRDHGYLDVRPWGMGKQTSPPSIPNGLSAGSDTFSLKAEHIGTINFAQKFYAYSFSEPDMLCHLADTVLDFTGPDLREFVSTLGTRMCGQDADEIMDHLSACQNVERMQDALSERCKSPETRSWPVDIRWLGEAMGLSDMSLKRAGKARGETPLGFLRAQGGSLHGGDTGAIIGVRCHSCHGNFLFRAALSKPASEMLSAQAYRIPGLSYDYSLKDGVGIVVQDGTIIGRMVWARAACTCRVVEEIELEYPEWEMPDPNTRQYGGR